MRSTGSLAMWGIVVLAVIGSASISLYASVAPVPEISASTVSAGLALLTGGILILRARMRRK